METTESNSGTTPQSEPDLKCRIADLMKAMQTDVFGFLLNRTRNEANAWDLTQETFLRAWKGRGNFDHSKDGRPWIMKIAEHVLVDHVRANSAQKRGRPISLDKNLTGTKNGADGKKTAEPIDGNWRDPEDALIQVESIAAMDAAASKLKEKDRLLYQLRREGLSITEMAKRTGRSEKSIGPALTRLIGKLRKMLSSENP